MIDLIKSSFEKIFLNKNSEKKSFKFKSITSNFQNIAQYDLEHLDTARIHTKDIIPYKYKTQINYKKEDLYTVIEANQIVSESIFIKKNIVEDSNIDTITENVKGILEDKLIESIDQMLLFSMSELGRITTSIYGQIKESIGTFTVSNLTTSDSIIQKIEYADIALKELNSIGLKHIIVSNLLFEKMKNHIVETKLKINHKLVSYQILPEHLESTDSLCLICTSQSPDDLTPGIVMVYKNLILDILENTNRDSLEFHLSKEYSIQKVGKRPEFFYIRFLQT